MSRLTLGQMLQPVGQILNQNPNGPKVIGYINRACEELLNEGRWVGTTIKYRVCTDKHIITWPREIETIEAMRVGREVVQIRNQWTEFQDQGPKFDIGFYDEGGWAQGFYPYRNSGMAIDAAEAICFAEICPTGHPLKLKVYGTAMEAAGSRILLQFYDQQGDYVWSNDSIEGRVDGEFVAISANNPQMTINPVTAWVGVQKPVTKGSVRITQFDTVTGLEKLLAVYEHDETHPSYRRSHIGHHFRNGQRDHEVTVIGSARFIPALHPRDYLPISSYSGIIWKAKAVYLGDNNNFQGAMACDQKATDVLNKQLAKWTGSGTIQTARFNPGKACENGPENFI